MYCLFIAQVRMVPAGPFGLYSNDVGAVFAAWPRPFGITTAGNTCTGCHRMGNMNSCNVTLCQSFGAKPTAGLGVWGAVFPQSHWMPPGDLKSEAQWNQEYADSIGELSACCQNPELAGCQIVHYGHGTVQR